MRRAIKIGIAVVAVVANRPCHHPVPRLAALNAAGVYSSEIKLTNHGTLIIDGNARGQREHGFSQRVGYRPPGSAWIEWAIPLLPRSR
jgi:hypothetical protein